jgi:hypothetical protein
VLFVVTVGVLPVGRAATFWTGTNLTWTKVGASSFDPIQPGKIELTRGGRDVLYNRVLEGAATNSSSAKGTLWAFGNSVTATNFSSCTGLTYQSMESLRSIAANNLSALILNKDMFVRLTNDDIYLSLKFTVWGRFGTSGGAVTYIRSTPPSAVPPTVSITSPSPGSVLAAAANVALKATATVAGGTVTNVQYFASGGSLGRATVAPFSVTASNLAAGSYSITAVATASGISATSGAVNITVVTPVPVSLSQLAISNGLFSFSYSANAGLRYVVERASNVTGANFLDWAPRSTNVAGSSLVGFSESAATEGSRVYRVGLLPNP